MIKVKELIETLQHIDDDNAEINECHIKINKSSGMKMKFNLVYPKNTRKIITIGYNNSDNIITNNNTLQDCLKSAYAKLPDGGEIFIRAGEYNITNADDNYD